MDFHPQTDGDMEHVSTKFYSILQHRAIISLCNWLHPPLKKWVDLKQKLKTIQNPLKI